MSYLSARTESTEGWTLDDDLYRRILRSVQRDTLSGCWIWREDRNRGNYGVVKVQSIHGTLNRLAHRVSYALFKGPLTPGLVVKHECDNRPCCNPDHLVEGTHEDNMQDLAERGPGGNLEHLIYEHMLADTSPWTPEMYDQPIKYDIKKIRTDAHEKYKAALRERREKERQKKLDEDRLRGFSLKDYHRLELEVERHKKTIANLRARLKSWRSIPKSKPVRTPSPSERIGPQDAEYIRTVWKRETGGLDWRSGHRDLLDRLASQFRVFPTTIAQMLDGKLHPEQVEYTI